MTGTIRQNDYQQQNDCQQQSTYQQQNDYQRQNDCQQQSTCQRQNELRTCWERAHGITVGLAAELPPGFSVGFAQDKNSATGCTVVICEQGAVAGVSVLGAAPATRETDLLRSENMVERIHALVLSGGSAFGLDAAGGVMRLLEKRGVGISFGGRRIPIVVGASLFDLEVGDDSAAPDLDMGYAAASEADRTLKVGNVGAGLGASVGKILGMDFCMKGGMGASTIIQDDLILTALVAVNALGCIFDPVTGSFVAGVLDPQTIQNEIQNEIQNDHPTILDPYHALAILAGADFVREAKRSNTTIGCILTNADLTKTQANRIAATTHDGYARAITPIHTSFDGDAIFCLSAGQVIVHPDVLGSLAALCMERAVINAVIEAQSAYGIRAACDL